MSAQAESLAGEMSVRDDAHARLPHPRQLAALGAVLCLYPASAGGELGGWAQAVRAEAGSELDSDGLRERMLFYDRDGRCCWRLYLLPDSDFLAWERLAASLPACAGEAHRGRIGERLWSRLAHRVGGERWRASALRLHPLPGGPGFGAFAHPPGLAASLATLSMLGATAARRIARTDAAEAEPFVEDCCCRQAALAAMQAAASAQGETAYSLIRFKPREPA